MSKWGVALLVAGLMQIGMSGAFAQFGGRGGPGGGGGFMYTPSMLAQQESVQAELKLTDEQKTKLKEAAEKARAGGRGAFGGGGNQEEARKKFEEMRAEAEKNVKAILTEEQLKRVKQIGLQQAGAGALANADVAKDLGLSEDQQKKVKDALNAQQEEMRKAFTGGGGGGNREDARDKMNALRKATNEKLEAVLTADQKAAFEKMKGEPFKGEIRFGFGRPNNN